MVVVVCLIGIILRCRNREKSNVQFDGHAQQDSLNDYEMVSSNDTHVMLTYYLCPTTEVEIYQRIRRNTFPVRKDILPR